VPLCWQVAYFYRAAQLWQPRMPPGPAASYATWDTPEFIQGCAAALAAGV